MFRSYKPSVKHSRTQSGSLIPHVGTTPKVFRTQNNQKKKLRSFAHFCARFADFLRPFAFLVFSEMAQKCPKVLRNVVRIGCPNWVSESVRIGCPNSVSESVRIGRPNWVSYRCFNKVPASCMPCPGKRTFKITNYILLRSESRFWFAHGCGPCLRNMWLCYLWDDI